MAREFKWLGAYRPAGFAWMTQDLHATGAIGDATLATAAKGEAALARGAQAFVELLREVDRFDLGAIARRTFAEAEELFERVFRDRAGEMLTCVMHITTKDGAEIYYKDWGKGQPIVFSHGWPLSADDWDAQMLFFLNHGYRVIAHDRRGHGRSTQTGDGHDMDHYADDLAALTAHLDLKNAIHVGHSTGGGEVVHYLARHGESRVAKAALISAVPPLMVKTAANPGGLPKKVFDDFQAQLAANRSQFYRDLAAGPFYGYNRPGAKPSEAVIANWWRQGMMGGAKAHYDGIVAFSQTDFTEDLKKITVPVLVMHSEDDQIVPYADSGPLSAKLLKNGTLKTYKGFPHGMPTTEAATINADLLAFLKR